MGAMAHHILVVSADGWVLEEPFMPDIEAFKAGLPEKWAPLIVGPFRGMVNDTLTWMFVPDGSKEGWPASDDGDLYRQQFADLFAIRYDEGSTPFDVALVQYGGDYPERANLTDPRQDWRTIFHEADGTTAVRRVLDGVVLADKEIE